MADFKPTKTYTVPQLKNASTWREAKWPEMKNDLVLRAARGEFV
jgi:hypothetical protein